MDGVTHGDILHSDVRHITFPNTVIQSPAFTIFPHSTLGKTAYRHVFQCNLDHRRRHSGQDH